ncbi:GtrA family protein [Paraburkholderia adhaesiva]|uniref:GtrA family protein n=1 Tax=Paraburkholderia adhaesiva TaxID=2883244 RepID=UPI001F3B6449|nr:GtrA family protein [Paraburkholderia adhaesiva]
MKLFVKQSRFSQFVVYACVGAAGTVAQYTVLSSLVLVHACGAVLASGLGAIAGAIVNYILNYRLTFRATASHGKTAPRFFSIAMTGVAINSALMFALIYRLQVGWLTAQCITTACVLILTYGANSLWTFSQA